MAAGTEVPTLSVADMPFCSTGTVRNSPTG